MRIRSISRVNIGTPLALPLGDVDERSEDGEGKWGCNTLYFPNLGASLGNEGMGFPPLIPGFSRKMRGFLPPFPNITYIL